MKKFTWNDIGFYVEIDGDESRQLVKIYELIGLTTEGELIFAAEDYTPCYELTKAKLFAEGQVNADESSEWCITERHITCVDAQKLIHVGLVMYRAHKEALKTIKA